jgi:APA family basic amino acid/polyamine antiporter
MPGDLPRRLGLSDSVAIVAGTVIGAGIFLTPNLVAQQAESPGLILAVWVAGAALSYVGALAYAELGAMMPATGGHYIFLKECFGPAAAFVCGWAMMTTLIPAAAGWLAMSFAHYLGHFVPLTPGGARVVAVALIGALSAVNYAGVHAGATAQKTLMAIKGAGLAALIGVLIASDATPGTPKAWFWDATLPARLGLAMLPALATYDGWVSLSFVAGEVRDAQRTIPRALAIGLAIVTALYLAANWAYLSVLAPGEIAASSRVGADAAARAMGPAGASAVSLIVLFSIAGSLNGWTITAPRIYFAQARDGLFFRFFGEVHPRYLTPARAIVLQAGWSSVMVFTGAYASLISYAMFAAWLIYGACVLGMVVLRRRQPERPRPYRMWGYPAAPLAFCAVCAGLLANTLYSTPGPGFASAGLIAAGVPVYYLWTSFSTGARNSRSSTAPFT